MAMISNIELSTHTGEKLSVKEKAFIDSFIICKNATQAAQEAGYSVKNFRQFQN